MDISKVRFLLYSALILSLSIFSVNPIDAQAIQDAPKILVKYTQGISTGEKGQVRSALVKINNKISSYAKASADEQNASLSFRQVSPEMDVFILDPGQSVDQFITSYNISSTDKSGLILAIEPDLSFNLSDLPTDPDFNKQWGLKNMGGNNATEGADISAYRAWNLQTSGKGVIGIIDTGIDYGHPDLVHNIWQNLAEDADGDGKVLELINGQWQLDPGDLDSIDADGNGYIDDLIGWDFINNDNNPFDDNGHGTHVSGIIGAEGDNAIGITGVAWHTEMMALKAFNEYGYGSLSDILPALAYARKMGVLLTNNSWGGSQRSEFLAEEIINARDAGQIFVAAAGNGGYSNPSKAIYPASYEFTNILAVTSTDSQDEVSDFSSTGRLNVDLAAPGEKIYSTLPGNTYGYKSGTSMAAGFVSGAVLLVKGAHPDLSISEIITLIQLNVDIVPALYGICRSNGRLNLQNALRSRRNTQNSTVLYASFDGPLTSCIQTPLSFVNTSYIPGSGEAESEWFLNGQSISTADDFNYTFTSPGWYELKLVLTEGSLTSETMVPIEITQPFEVDLGPDTSLCASAYLLDAGTEGQELQWIQLHCPDNTICLGAEDYTTLDPIHFKIYGGQTNGFVNKYILTDKNDRILVNATSPDFDPLNTPGTYRFYSVHHWPGTIVRGMEPGNHLTDIDMGVDSCSQISAPHEFHVWEATDLGDSPMLSARESGIYILNVRDGCGSLTTDTLMLTLNGSCVWPGDVNVDGKVSIEDFLCLGIAKNQRGPARSQVSTTWMSHTSVDWPTSFDENNVFGSSVNHKHADVNGDGIVDMQQDLQGIKNNLNFFHEIQSPPIEGGASFYLDHINTTFSDDGDTAKILVGIYLEDNNNSVGEDVYGIAFNLNFSDPVALEPKILPSDPSLGSTEYLSFFPDELQGGLETRNISFTREKFGFGMIGTESLSYTGSRLIASGKIIVIVDDIVEDSIRSGYSSFGITPQNIVLIDAIGQAKGILSSSSLNTFEVDINWPSPVINWFDFKAWSAADDIVLEWGSFGERTYDLFQIERSIDGRIFERIGEIPVQIRGGNSYIFRDINARKLSNQELLYRIKHLNFTGGATYSETLTVPLGEAITDNLRVYPNPVADNFIISYATVNPASASISIINGLGQVMNRFPHIEDFGEIKVDSRSWPPGIYFIRLHSSLGTQVLKTVKQ